MTHQRMTIITIGIIVAYLMWMDIILYHKVQSINITYSSSATTSKGFNTDTTIKSGDDHYLSPFKGLSVKLIMMDQANNYIFNPLAEGFEEVTKFSESFPFISPNLISTIGVICAAIGAKFILQDTLSMHRIAVLVFQLRTFFDALDGIVARQRLGIHFHLSVRSTTGFYADAIADTIGYVIFVVACLLHLRRRRQPYLPLVQTETIEINSENGISNGLSTKLTSPNNNGHCPNGYRSTTIMKRLIKELNPIKSSRQMVKIWYQNQPFFVVLCFSIQLAITSISWNRYIEQYHLLLESPATSDVQALKQSEILHSSSTWIIFWFWKLSCGHSLMNMMLISIFIGKLWDFLNWIQFIGIVELLMLSLITEVHLSQSWSYLMSS